jgi:hypothetical protein
MAVTLPAFAQEASPTTEPKGMEENQAVPKCGPADIPPCPQLEVPPPPAPPPPPPVAKHETKHSVVFAPSEISLTTGAGPANYFGSGNTTNMEVGAVWDARVTVGAHSIMALEAGYVGGINNIDNVGDNGNRGHVSSQGFDTDFRLQLPTYVQPYIFAGVGYNHMSVHTDGNPTLASLRSTGDDQVTIPAGAGLTGYLGKHATLDLRGTYKLIPDNEVTAFNTSALHQWVAQARVGYTF